MKCCNARNGWRILPCALLVLGSLAAVPGEAFAAEKLPGLRLENKVTEQVYFSYHGKPLLSFGGMRANICEKGYAMNVRIDFRFCF